MFTIPMLAKQQNDLSRFLFINLVASILLATLLFLTYVICGYFTQNTYEITKVLYITAIFLILPIIATIHYCASLQQDLFFISFQKKLCITWMAILSFLAYKSYFLFFSLTSIISSTHVFLLILLGIAWLWYCLKNRPVTGKGILYGILILLHFVLAFKLFRVYELWPYHGGKYNFINFNATFSSVVQAADGKLPLVNYYAQYGYYSIFIGWLFHLLPFSVLTSYSFFMAALAVSVFGFLFLGLKKIIQHLFIRLAVLMACFYALFYSIKVPYWANLPIRSIFPCIVFCLIAHYHNNKNNTKYYYLIFSITTLSTFWNLDTGAVLFLSWVFFLSYIEWITSPSLKDCFLPILKIVTTAVFFLIFMYGGYGVLTFLKTGVFPHYNKLFIYQNDFFGKGILSIPMKPFDAWSFVVLIYIAGFVYGFDKEKIRNDKSRYQNAPFIAFLCVMGAGFFSYFLMRSYPTNIFIVIWPAVVLLGIAAETMLMHQRYFASFLSSFVLVLWSITALANANMLPAISPEEKTTWMLFLKERNWVASLGLKQQPVIILSDKSGIFYGDSGSICPILIPGATEILNPNFINRIMEYAKNKKSHGFLLTDTSMLLYSNSLFSLVRKLEQTLPIVKKSPDNKLILYAINKK